MTEMQTNHLVSEIRKILVSDQDTRARRILQTLSERWKSDSLAHRILQRFETNPEDFSHFLEDLLKEKLPQNRELAEALHRIVLEKETDYSDASELAELSEQEIDVLQALEQIGGGGSPIDIAVEGMLDIEQTHKTAERLWRKGLLLSHPLKDTDAKRFFSFSDLNKGVYRKLLETSNARLAEKS